MLNICKEAYEKANGCTDNDENKEDWIYSYMMAKIEEKLHRNKIFDPLKRYVAVRRKDLMKLLIKVFFLGA